MFEQRVSQDIADEQLYAGLMRSAFVTHQQVEAYTKLQNQKRDIDYILVSHQQFMKSLKVSDEEIERNFLILPASDFNPFITECAIYDASTDCIACAAPGMEDNKDVIRYNTETAQSMAKSFRSIWRKYKRKNP